MVRAAEASDLDILAITDHLWEPYQHPDWLEAARSSIREAMPKIPVLLGVELTGTRTGKVEVCEELRRSVDLVLCEHPLPSSSEGGVSEYLERVKEGIEYVVSIPKVDVLVHPLNLGRSGVVKDFRYLSRDFLDEVASIIGGSGVIVEVMSQMYWWFPFMTVSSFTEAYTGFIKLCRHHGARFSIGSDAHSACGVGNIRWALKVLEKAGVTLDEIWLPSQSARR